MYGLNIDPMNSHGNPPAAELQELGVQMVRFTWKDNQPGPQLNPQALEFYIQKLNELEAAGIGSLIILSYETYPNKPAFSDSDEIWMNYISAYSLRCSQIVAFTGQFNPAYQIWNEPDLPPNPAYEPSLREGVYGSMLRRTREVIKVYGDESTLVVGAGLASGDPAWWARVVESQPGVPLLDINALHPYGQRPEPNWPDPNWGFGYVGDLISRYQAVFNGPWWITESGVDSLSDEEQGEYLRRMYKTIKTEFPDKVNQLFWFCYSSGMVTPYGLVEASSVRKPAYEAYRQSAGVTA
jgi:hypothetical protein